MMSTESSLEFAMKQVSQFTPFPLFSVTLQRVFYHPTLAPLYGIRQPTGVGWCLSRDYRVLGGEITRIKRPVRWCQGHLKFMFPYRILIPKRKCITTYDSTFLLSNPILSLPKQWGWWTICELERSLVFHILSISDASLLINYLDKSQRMTTNCK